MTSLIMPSDYGMEMLVGSSPVLGSGFLGGSPYFSDYSSRCGSPVWSQNPPVSCHASFGMAVNSDFIDGLPSAHGLPSQTLRRTNSNRMSTRKRKISTVTPPILLNLKSCLAQSKLEEPTPEGAISPSKEKKKVSFADVLGGNLTHIKIITERPDCPPKWSQEFLEQVTNGAKAEAVPDQWALTFAQPAADYINWKSKLERDNIALENIIIKQNESLIQGTIKVRNLSFQKEVIVRYSTNSWLSYDDVYANYVVAPSAGSSYNIYDTFKFEIPLPNSSLTDKFEFCLSLQSDSQSFWDNNNGKNYALVSFRSQKNLSQDSSDKPKDIYDLTIQSWSEFSAWNHLDLNESPYW